MLAEAEQNKISVSNYGLSSALLWGVRKHLTDLSHTISSQPWWASLKCLLNAVGDRKNVCELWTGTLHFRARTMAQPLNIRISIIKWPNDPCRGAVGMICKIPACCWGPPCNHPMTLSMQTDCHPSKDRRVWPQVRSQHRTELLRKTEPMFSCKCLHWLKTTVSWLVHPPAWVCAGTGSVWRTGWWLGRSVPSGVSQTAFVPTASLHHAYFFELKEW